MLHELLFVLSGYPGDVFTPYPPPPKQSSTFAIASSFELLHPAERESLNRLGQLGWIYAQINQFITGIKDLRHDTKDKSRPHGSYVQTFVTCIESTLNDYRKDILEIEKRILNKELDSGQGIVSLSLLKSNLGRWEILFPLLWSFIQRLEEEPQKYHGCLLFNLVIDQARTGITEMRMEMEKMMVQLHNVLYRQLTTWMVYGQWVDPDNEFFIERCQDTAEKANIAGWNRLYCINYDKVPLHISHDIVESILFVGKAIATINEMDKIPASGNLHEDNTRSIRSLNFNQKIRVPEELKKRHLKLLLMLHSSQQNTRISPWIRYSQQLQSTVDQVRRSTTDWLFSKVLVNEHGLQRYLISFKSFFLLDYGDWAVNFIHECRQWQRRSIARTFGGTTKLNVESSKSKTTLIFRKQELNTLLVKATQGTEAEDQLDGYSLLVQDSIQYDYPFSDLLLSDVNAVLTYKLEWPIDLFLSESDLENYSNIWCFLIGLKNTQMLLNKLWKTLRTTRSDKGQGRAYQKDEHQERLVWRLRGLMSFWVDTFWNHLQFHVISSHHKQLIDSTTTINDNKKGKLEFEDIQEAHSHFLDNLISGCLLSTDCSIIIHKILKSCSGFCELMERLSEDGKWQQSKRRKTTKTAADIVNQWTSSNPEASWIDEVQKMDKDFLLLTEKFFVLASNQAPEVKSSGRLDALLMQLDHNNWYSGRR